MDNKELIAQLQKQAESESEASKRWAQAKSLRQHDREPRRDDLYSWSKPEQTLSWKAVQALTAAEACIDALQKECNHWCSVANERAVKIAELEAEMAKRDANQKLNTKMFMAALEE